MHYIDDPHTKRNHFSLVKKNLISSSQNVKIANYAMMSCRPSQILTGSASSCIYKEYWQTDF